MRAKTKWFLILAVCGVLICVAMFLPGDSLPKQWDGILLGIGSGMFALGLAKFTFSRSEEKNPAQWKQNVIEANDERNIAIRRRAQAMSGLVLQWSIIAIAWIAILLDWELWIILTAVGFFCGKTILDFALMAYYQQKM